MISIVHKTQYQYDRGVLLSPHLFRLAPYVSVQDFPHRYLFSVQPAQQIFWQQDVYGNKVARVNFQGKLDAMSVEVQLEIEPQIHNPFNFLIDQQVQVFPFTYPARIHEALLPYLRTNEYGPLLSTFVEEARAYRGDTLGLLSQLTQSIYEKINYNQRFEQGVQHCEQTLQISSGSCRDSAWLLVEVFRHLGVASRFVSGYLVQKDTKDGHIVDLHAWTEVFIPGAGWIGLDTTSGLFTSNLHIALSVGPVPEDTAPVQGTTDPCISTMNYWSTVRIS